MANRDVSGEKKSYKEDAVSEDASATTRRPLAPANFQMLYESRDGKFCLFETREGHLSAVKASRFA